MARKDGGSGDQVRKTRSKLGDIARPPSPVTPFRARCLQISPMWLCSRRYKRPGQRGLYFSGQMVAEKKTLVFKFPYCFSSRSLPAHSTPSTLISSISSPQFTAPPPNKFESRATRKGSRRRDHSPSVENKTRLPLVFSPRNSGNSVSNDTCSNRGFSEGGDENRSEEYGKNKNNRGGRNFYSRRIIVFEHFSNGVIQKKRFLRHAFDLGGQQLR